MRKPYIFSDWLKAQRNALGLSRTRVAERSGGEISQQYIHLIETGVQQNIGSDKLRALASGLGLPLVILQRALFDGVVPEIPLTGRISGGPEVNALSEEYVNDGVTYEANPQLFAMEMMGDSMAPKIEHGDIVIANPECELVSGRVYVLSKNKKRTCKYLVQDQNDPETWWICAENESLFEREELTRNWKIGGLVIETRKTMTLCKPVLS